MIAPPPCPDAAATEIFATREEGNKIMREQYETEDAEQLKDRICRAVDIANQCAFYDGAHHKNWVINEMITLLTTPEYRDAAGWNLQVWLEECIAP